MTARGFSSNRQARKLGIRMQPTSFADYYKPWERAYRWPQNLDSGSGRMGRRGRVPAKKDRDGGADWLAASYSSSCLTISQYHPPERVSSNHADDIPPVP